MKSLKVIWALIRYQPLLYAGDQLSWILIHMSPLIPGVLYRTFFDNLSGAAPAAVTPEGLIALTIAFAGGQMVLRAFGFLTDMPHRFMMGSLLRTNIFTRILGRPGAQAVPGPVGDLFNVMRDDARQVEDLLSWLCDFSGMLAFAGFAFVSLMAIHVEMALLVFAPLLVVGVIAQAAANRIQIHRYALRDADSAVADSLNEMFEAAQAIQVAGAEARVVERFRRLSEARKRAAVRDRVFSQMLELIISGAVSVGTGLILLVAAGAMQPGMARPFTVGDFALFVYYLTTVSGFTVFAGRIFSTGRQAMVAIERMAALLPDEPVTALAQHRPLYLRKPMPAPAQPEREPLNRLSVRGLTYVYPSTRRGVRDVTVDLERNTLTVVTGRIGSGKTTLVRALLGLLPSQAGEITWNGRLVEDPAAFFVPPRSAYVAQAPRLFSQSLRDNVLLGHPARAYGEGPLPSDGLSRALWLAVLEEDVAGFEKGVETQVGTRGVRLSGGQAQRAAAARAYAQDAELLVLDDLSSALDVVTERVLWERWDVQRASGGGSRTALAVSHRRAALKRADRVLVLKDGRVEDAGTLEELLGRCEEMRQIWNARDAGEDEPPAP